MQFVTNIKKSSKETRFRIRLYVVFTKAVTRALQLYPDVNSMIDGQEKISYDFCDISVAVSGSKRINGSSYEKCRNIIIQRC